MHDWHYGEGRFGRKTGIDFARLILFYIGFSFTNISEGTAFLQGLTYYNIGKRKIYIPQCKISLASFVSIYPIIAD